MPSAPAKGRVPVGFPCPVVVVVFLQHWLVIRMPICVAADIQIVTLDAGARCT